MCPHCEVYFFPHNQIRKGCDVCGHPDHCFCAGQYLQRNDLLQPRDKSEKSEKSKREKTDMIGKIQALQTELDATREQLFVLQHENKAKGKLLKQMLKFLQDQDVMIEFLMYQAQKVDDSEKIAEVHHLSFGDDSGSIPF